MALQGRVLTRHFAMEPRQHEILGIDLGEGPTRKMLVLGLVLYALWWGLLALLLGLLLEHPLSRANSFLWIIPPGLALWWITQPSPLTERRTRLVDVLAALNFWVRGHKPIVRMSTHRPTRQERSSRGAAPWTRMVPGDAQGPEWARDDHNADAITADAEAGPTGPPMTITARPMLISGPTLADRLTPRRSRGRRTA